MSSKGTVKISSTKRGSGGSGLTKVTAVWPSGKTFSRWVGDNDAVNEQRRQERFAEENGYSVRFDWEDIKPSFDWEDIKPSFDWEDIKPSVD